MSGQVYVQQGPVRLASLSAGLVLKDEAIIVTKKNGRALLVRGEQTMIVAPNSCNRPATVDFPAPIPPVSPIHSMTAGYGLPDITIPAAGPIQKAHSQAWARAARVARAPRRTPTRVP